MRARGPEQRTRQAEPVRQHLEQQRALQGATTLHVAQTYDWGL